MFIVFSIRLFHQIELLFVENEKYHVFYLAPCNPIWSSSTTVSCKEVW